MRNIAFMLTKQQILNQTKTVTRRNGWDFLRPGDLLQPVFKGQGIPKGEHVEKLGCPIRVLNTRIEKLDRITSPECVKEGFPELTPELFVAIYCEANASVGIRGHDVVNRIEFEYTEDKGKA